MLKVVHEICRRIEVTSQIPEVSKREDVQRNFRRTQLWNLLKWVVWCREVVDHNDSINPLNLFTRKRQPPSEPVLKLSHSTIAKGAHGSRNLAPSLGDILPSPLQGLVLALADWAKSLSFHLNYEPNIVPENQDISSFI